MKPLRLILWAGMLALLLTGCQKKEKISETEITESVSMTKEAASVTESATQEVGESLAEAVDARAYYEDRAAIREVIDAAQSPLVTTEKETVKDMKQRGFDAFPLTFDGTVGGEYLGDTEIDKAGSEKHPVYTTYYITGAGEVWEIFMINGAVYAFPLGFNADSGAVPVILSETESITGYDHAGNRFYVTIPDPTELRVKVVSRVDTQTLEGMSREELSK